MLSSVCRNTQSSPRPRNGGEGSGVRGQWHPCHGKETRESGKERTPKPLRFIRENPCSSVAGKTALIRRHQWLFPRACRGVSPSPPAPLPFQGRGVLSTLSSVAEKHPSSVAHPLLLPRLLSLAGGQVCQCVAFSQHTVKFHTAAEGFSIAATIVLEFSLAPDLTGRKHHLSNSDDSNSPDADQ